MILILRCPLFFSLVALATISFLPHVASAQNYYVTLDATDIELKLERVGPAPLPYQPIRVRLTLLNKSDRRLGPPLAPAEIHLGFLFKGPQDTEFRGARAGVRLKDSDSTGSVVASNQNFAAPLFLDPKEQTSVTSAMAGEWKDQDGDYLPADVVRPIFPRPGRYELKTSYYTDNVKRLEVEAKLTVEVAVPKGDDKAIYELLQKDPALAHAMLLPVDAPDKKLVPALKGIIDRYPASSYTDYARFALARAHMNGSGLVVEGSRIDLAIAATELDILIQHDFPYQANARIALAAIDASTRKGTAGVMNRTHADAVEWLDVAGRDLESEEWRKFRKWQPPSQNPAPKTPR